MKIFISCTTALTASRPIWLAKWAPSFASRLIYSQILKFSITHLINIFVPFDSTDSASHTHTHAQYTQTRPFLTVTVVSIETCKVTAVFVEKFIHSNNNNRTSEITKRNEMEWIFFFSINKLYGLGRPCTKLTLSPQTKYTRTWYEKQIENHYMTRTR